MGWWLVNADTLAGSRFTVSALAETTASLKHLEWGTGGHPGERAWLDAHRPKPQNYIAAAVFVMLWIVFAWLLWRWLTN